MVLSGFMAGLALGNYIVAQHGDKIKKPMKFYALLEIIIGITGSAIVFLLPFLQEMFVPVFNPFLENQFILNAIRLSSIFIILTLPTSAMGATLPIMVKALLTQDKNFGSVLGGLYGINT